MSEAMLCCNAIICMVRAMFTHIWQTLATHDHPCSPLLHSGHSSKPRHSFQAYSNASYNGTTPVLTCECMSWVHGWGDNRHVHCLWHACYAAVACHLLFTFSTHETWVMSSKHWVIMSLLPVLKWFALWVWMHVLLLFIIIIIVPQNHTLNHVFYCFMKKFSLWLMLI